MTSIPTHLLIANGGPEGRELWISDGSQGGTRLLKDIHPGLADAAISGLTRLDAGHYVFSANDGEHGSELWITNGTESGTRLLKDVAPGLAGSAPEELTSDGSGRVYFLADDGLAGRELWVTDGTEAGTYRLRDVRAGESGSRAGELTALGDGRVLFRADDGVSGPELWVTDGTRSGTQRVSDLSAGSTGSLPRELTGLGDGRALFQAALGGDVTGLWVTDGTESGTRRLPWTGVSDLTAVGAGVAMFTARTETGELELWRTDGTEAGGARLAVLPAGTVVGELTGLGDGRVLFRKGQAEPLGDYGEGGVSSELWVTDGTESGTHLVRNQIYSSMDSVPSQFTSLGDGRAVFVLEYELWMTDGTAGGTYQLETPPDSRISNLSALENGRLVFRLEDREHGVEWWTTDGTATGTGLMADIRQGTEGSFNPHGLSQLGTLFNDLSDFPVESNLAGKWTLPGGRRLDFLYESAPISSERSVFWGSDPAHGRELWVTDGRLADARLLKEITPGAAGSPDSNFIPLDEGRVLFTANGLWVTDGTEAGTVRLGDAGQFLTPSQGQAVTLLGDGRWLVRTDTGVLVTDGTAAGTVGRDAAIPAGIFLGSARGTLLGNPAGDGAVRVLATGVNQSSVSERFQTLAGSLAGGLQVFVKETYRSNTNVNTREIFVTDGTPEGARSLLTGDQGLQAVVFQGQLHVLARDADAPNQVTLWRVDADTSEMVQVDRFYSGSGPYRGLQLRVEGQMLVYGLSQGTLWTSSTVFIEYPAQAYLWDGQHRIEAPGIFLGAGSSITLRDGGHNLITEGEEWWVSDGALSGFRSLPAMAGRQLIQGQFLDAQGNAQSFSRLPGDGGVLFWVKDDAHGAEPWVWSGGEAEPFLLKDLSAGAAGSKVVQAGIPMPDGRHFLMAIASMQSGEPQLWVSDGTSEGTRLLAEVLLGGGCPIGITPMNLRVHFCRCWR